MDGRRIDGVARVGARRGTSLIAIGNFDGVHRGHRAVIGLAVERARALGLAPLVLTFHPHPHVVFGRGDPLVLTPLERKVELLQRLDPALRVVVEPFTLDLAALSAERFVDEVLVSALGAGFVVVGPDFCFGRGRAGDFGLLVALGAERGFVAMAPPLAGDRVGPFSSTRARQAIAVGDVAAAAEVLGRPHAISGRVARGDGRGRSLGAPTANLIDIPEVVPADGVYACLVDRVTGVGAARLGAGVMNLGVRPTVNAGRSVEVHLFDLDQDLVGAALRVHLVARLREERRFPSPADLSAQIARDVASARAVLGGCAADPGAGGAWF